MRHFAATTRYAVVISMIRDAREPGSLQRLISWPNSYSERSILRRIFDTRCLNHMFFKFPVCLFQGISWAQQFELPAWRRKILDAVPGRLGQLLMSYVH